MKIKTIFMFLILLVSMAPLTTGASSVVFNEIEVNDVDVTAGGRVAVDRGEDLDIRVEIYSPVDYEDVRVRASVEGYEYDEIEDYSKTFDITEGSTYTKNLHLFIPEDIDEGDYVLYIEVKNADGVRIIYDIVLQIEKSGSNSGHDLDIQDIILRPNSRVEAGRPLGVEVRVENMGSRKEEDIKVVASIKSLGVSTRAYLDELGSEEADEDDDETSGNVMLYLPIPVDAISGEYDLDVDVEYNRGHDVTSAKTKVFVEGTEAKADVNTIISIDAVSKSVSKGEQVVYRLMLANLGDNEALYSLSVSGTGAWADVSLQPGFVRVSPGDAGELNLIVSPKENVVAGEHSFSVNVKEGDNVLRSISLSASVSKGGVAVKSVLQVGFAVLIVLLVILGLVVAFKKMGNREEEEPEPIMDNGQSYY